MTDDQRDFKRDIIKILIDKFLIGGIILLLGILGTTIVEKYKAKEAFYNELNKIRVSKIGEVWEQAYLLDYRMKQFEADWLHLLKGQYKIGIELGEEMGRELAKELDKPLRYPERIVTDTTKKAMEKHKEFLEERSNLEQQHLDEFTQTLHSNRFWLDDESFTAIDEYVSTVYRLKFDTMLSLPPEKWPEIFERRQAELLKQRENIQSVRRRLFSVK